MLSTTGSAELAEWMAELRLRAEDQAAAIAAAREEAGQR